MTFVKRPGPRELETVRSIALELDDRNPLRGRRVGALALRLPPQGNRRVAVQELFLELETRRSTAAHLTSGRACNSPPPDQARSPLKKTLNMRGVRGRG